MKTTRTSLIQHCRRWLLLLPQTLAFMIGHLKAGEAQARHTGLQSDLSGMSDFGYLAPDSHSFDSPQFESHLRAELFSVEQMEKHGQTLACIHALTKTLMPDKLLHRLAHNEAVITDACTTLSESINDSNRISPAGEWLLDNFYLIEEQIRTTKRHLPKGYGRGLPKLAQGHTRGYPRVYDIALHVIAHGDGRWDPENLSRFISAYQSASSLTLGELWAVPIMLRLALIENLARVSERVALGRQHRNIADAWADRMVDTAESDPKSLILVIADMARSGPPLTCAFVAELARRLQGRGVALALPLTWIEQRLAENGLTLEQQVQNENQQQATNQTTVSNSIASLRRLGEMDWREFVEQMSVVHRLLLSDPANTYAGMNFATRDQYRHVVEKLARDSLMTESDVAAAAINLAHAFQHRLLKTLVEERSQRHALLETASEAAVSDARRSHVGFYLIGNGRYQLERAVLKRRSILQRLQSIFRHRPVRSYIGLIAVLTIIPSAYLLYQAYQDGLSSRLLARLDFYWSTAAVPHVEFDLNIVILVLLGCALLLAISQLAIALVNWAAVLFVRPHTLPRMDFSKGIPTSCRTLVVVPAMLSSAESIGALVEALEVRFLGNRDAAIHFALLTDFNDASSEHCPSDAALLALAAAQIKALNQRYSISETQHTGDIFFLFHRPRQWNASEQQWMGYERKRGKLSDLNVLLLSTADTRPAAAARFALIEGDTRILMADINQPDHDRVKYIITLDSDTQLPRESARQFIGAMAHPLNRPRYDVQRQRVVEGHGILQPRMAEALPSPGPSRYARLFGSEPGIDPYTRSVSDVYQDLFDEGSFIGKGIYDIDVFEQALGERFPENTILSHDLIEGCYLRSGLLSDVPLYEQSPGSYLVDARRRTRWIRGDWQLAGWLLPGVMDGHGTKAPNPLTSLSLWKLFDNLRRSLVPVALMLLIALSWSVLDNPYRWLTVVVTILGLPTVIALLLELINKPSEVLLSQHLLISLRGARWRIGQLILQLATLPHEAAYSLGAIAHTSWRMLISHQHLLEWTPSDQAGRNFNNTPAAWLRELWLGPAAAVVVACLLLRYQPSLYLLALPLLLLWLTSPLIAGWISQPFRRKEARLNATQQRFLRTTARRTWDYFVHFVGLDDHWLPPDNYQEAPAETLAHRTSPTNMGLALLANLSAYDFGYLSMGELLERTGNTLRTMSGLERYQGHFFNWYDTQTLQPLPPRYVSTVDSGNLAGHLIVLQQGLIALATAPLRHHNQLNGLMDTLNVITESTKQSHPALAAFRTKLQTAPTHFKSLHHVSEYLNSLSLIAEKIVVECAASEALPITENNYRQADTAQWAQKLLAQCQAMQTDMLLFAGGVDDQSPSDSALNTLSENPKTEASVLATVQQRLKVIGELAAQANAMAKQDYSFLYDTTSHLMTVGFNVESRRRDRGNYDLLSSEARLGIYVAIAQGEVPQESWFALGRLLTLNEGQPILVSWSGSMFEYLMPLLVMPAYDNTLLDQTCHAAVLQQISYGKKRGVAWGVSESGFNAVDAHLNYQYRAFGVPGLGLKRGLAEDLVIAPYASAMALMIAPEAACINMQRLAKEGALGRFGFYEAIDYTPARLPRGKENELVRSFMVHHQGMSLLALSYLLHQRPMQQRFVADTEMQAALLLLQERIPKPVASYSQIAQSSAVTSERGQTEASIRVFEQPNTPTPEVQLLSNGRYHLMLTQAGSGYSRWKDLAITRWRADGTCDDWGMFSYVRDVTSGAFWSTSYQPIAASAEGYKAVFSESHAEFNRREHEIETHTEIGVSPEDDIELRRVRIHNRSRVKRTIEYTSYAEVVLAPHASDLAHPAFSNLFVETEILPQQHAILATRRPRSEQEQPPWLCHMLTVYGDIRCTTSYETDRARFIGRGNTLAAPRAMLEPGALSGTAGAVLDPIISIRCRMTLEAGASITLDLITGVSENRNQALDMVEKYRDRRLANRVFGLAWTHNQVLLRQLNASEADAQLYSQLAGSIIYSNANHRAAPNVLIENQRGQSGLWGYAISGDLPIVLLHIAEASNIGLVRQLLQAHTYWRKKGLAVDLVILNEEGNNYRQVLQDQIIGLITVGTSINTTDRSGGIFVRTTAQMPTEDRILLQSVAHVVLSDKYGTLAEQMAYRPSTTRMPPTLIASTNQSMLSSGVSNALSSTEMGIAFHSDAANKVTTSNVGTAANLPNTINTINSLAHPPSTPLKDLRFFNGLGGFKPSGDEYVISLDAGQSTPAPWVNVIANPNFGTVISESGQAYTWTDNAHETRLTPWENDPVRDTSSELYYLRDEDTGHHWSPTALPRRGNGTYTTRHGFGYSVFEHMEDGIQSSLCVHVAMDTAIKFASLTINNASTRKRRLSAYGYVAWVLGDLRAKTAMHVVTELDSHGAILARNPYNTEFGERTAFFHVATSSLEPITRSCTGDRTEFIGRNGSHQTPAALHRKRLSGRVGAGFDPCAAIQVGFDLAPGQSRELVFILGVGRDRTDASALIERFRGRMAAQESLTETRQHWQQTLGKVRVATPDPALDLLANGWLMYQTIASRLWARSGYYQSGGAFGFRDQLQDAMALVHNEPERLRAQLLLCAAHQFIEGDVQHWWHPPQGRGVRTRCSDDYLWLPFALCRYIQTSGDTSILNESIPFLFGRQLNDGEESYYDLPVIANEQATLYEHARRAIEHGLRFGCHGLPLIGSGDWNDGMNLVGEHGKGESVWLGFFLYSILRQFAPVAAAHNDADFSNRCQREQDALQAHIETHGWDGDWYRRAYFDDGTPLGSASNSECQIDAIAQSWAVLSRAAPAARAAQAMDALNSHLVRTKDGLVQLLTPPFDHGALNPGYIKGYLPGIRENGGQYTHGAIWATMAFAELGDYERAWQLFNIINPINHSRTRAEVSVYKIEPYVLAADVYGVAPHIGRGGWSWYTGSAGWMYRLIIESLLGMHLEHTANGAQLHFKPCLPSAWHGFDIDYQYGKTQYHIAVKQNALRAETTQNTGTDDTTIETGACIVSLVDDGEQRHITLMV